MKNTLLILSIFMGLANASFAQKIVPNVFVEALNGEQIKASEFENENKPIIISFWATWCKPCISELDAIADEYEDWQEETGVTLIAISIDDERSVATVKTMTNGRDWPFQIYLDKNQSLKRALNVINIPHTILLNGKGEIVWQRNSYVPGSEDELFEEIKKTLKEDSK